MKSTNTFKFIFLFVFACIIATTVNSQTVNATRKLYWSASAGNFTGEQNMWSINPWFRLNNMIKSLNNGKSLDAYRCYDQKTHVNISTSSMAAAVNYCSVIAGTFRNIPATWQNTIDGSDSLVISNYVKSFPVNREIYLGYYHEPEPEALGTTGLPGNTPDLFLRAFAKFVDIVVSTGRTNVHPCLVYMTWTFDPMSLRNPEDFNPVKYIKPAQLSRVIAGLDGYSDDPLETAKGVFESPFLQMQKWGFSRFGIFETSVQPSDVPNERIAWVESLGQWINSGVGIAKNIEIVSWWSCQVSDVDVPWFIGTFSVDSSTGAYSMIDDGTIKAFANACLLNKPSNNNQLLGVYDFTTGANQLKASNVMPGLTMGDITTKLLRFSYKNDKIEIKNWPSAISISGGSCINIPITKLGTASAFNISKVDVTLRRSANKKPIQMNFGNAVNATQIAFAKDTPFGRKGYHTFSLLEGTVGTGKAAVLIPEVTSTATQYFSIGTATAGVNDTVYIDKIEVYGTVKYPITANSNNALMGSVSGGITECGALDTLNAIPKVGYRFVNWTENGTEVSKVNPYVFTVTSPRTLIANFTTITGINDSESESDYKVFVNSNNQIIVQAPEKSQVDVCNLMGKKIKKIITSSANETISSVFLPGAYIIMLTVDGKSIMQKIVIR